MASAGARAPSPVSQLRSRRPVHRVLQYQERCPNCGILLERGESDYFLGAYTLNLIAVEILLALGFVVVMYATWPNPPWDALEYGGVVLSILGAVLCYPFAKTLWLAVDLIFRPPHSAKTLSLASNSHYSPAG